MITLDELIKVQEECSKNFNRRRCTYFCNASTTFSLLWEEHQEAIKELGLKFLEETKSVDYRIGIGQVLFRVAAIAPNLPEGRIQIRTQFLEWWIIQLTKNS